MKYILIDEAHSADIRLKNEPFPLTGRLIPTYADQKWSYTVQPAEAGQMCFPDEPYEFGKHAYIGAYDGEVCVGLAVLSDAWFKYMYLEDLKVNSSHRHRGVGRGLMEKAMEIALSRGYHGLYAVCQDNNLAACQFYLRVGFEIGGFDNRVYRGTAQQDKADILFYLDAQPSSMKALNQ